ncbi:MAG: hypothetical protein IT380_00900 [Myxococcales bacterium]|nr:hypothetical protein [Myxococcales bacterium]
MIGGVAVIARGVPRFTADIDVAIKPTNDTSAEEWQALARRLTGPPK